MSKSKFKKFKTAVSKRSLNKIKQMPRIQNENENLKKHKNR